VATTAFDKDFYKLMYNAVLGKTMENMRKIINVELVNTSKRLRKVCAKPNFQSFKICNDDLVAVNLRKTNIVLNICRILYSISTKDIHVQVPL
jgi:translation initiation factor IF-1